MKETRVEIVTQEEKKSNEIKESKLEETLQIYICEGM